MALCLTTAITAGAIAQSWVDVTDTYIVNPSYENGTTGWTDGTAEPVVNATYQNAEFYNKKNSALQTISGLQAGKYKLTVQAFFRPQGNNQAEIDKHNNGTEVIEGYVVAGDSAVKIKSLFSEPNNATVSPSQSARRSSAAASHSGLTFKSGIRNSPQPGNACRTKSPFFSTAWRCFSNGAYFSV